MEHMLRDGYCLILPAEKKENSLEGFKLPDEYQHQAEGTLKLNGDSEDKFPLESKVLYERGQARELEIEGVKYHLVKEEFVFIALNVVESK